MKICTCCGIEKPLSEFTVRRASHDGRTTRCTVCLNEQKKAAYRADPNEMHKARARAIASFKRRGEESPGFKNSWKVWRKLKMAKRIPKWQRHAELVPIYEEAAAKGLIVDHLIPLRGKYVCGLHVLSNLVLTDPVSNSMKGAKYPCVVLVSPKRVDALRRKEKWDTLRASI